MEKRDALVLEREIRIPIDSATLAATLAIPPGATGLVLFAHGSGSSRHSVRNRHVARLLNAADLATLLADLLTMEEEEIDRETAEFRFDVELLAERVVAITDWLRHHPEAHGLSLGYFGASTGAAAALIAAAERPARVRAVVSRGGRPDLAGPALARVVAPTLLIVGSADTAVLALNESAFEQLQTEKRLAVVPGATHLFEEPGALDEVARLAREWFERYLVLRAAHAESPRAP